MVEVRPTSGEAMFEARRVPWFAEWLPWNVLDFLIKLGTTYPIGALVEFDSVEKKVKLKLKIKIALLFSKDIYIF